MKQIKKNKWVDRIKLWSTSTIFIISVIVVFRTFLFDWSVVPSGSMSRTFLTGDVVLNNKLAYKYDWTSIPIIGIYFAQKKIINIPNLHRGDIIVFCGKKDYITKRVIGLPGDTVTWDHIDLQVNGKSTMFWQDGSRIFPGTRKYTLTRNHHDLNINELMDEIDSILEVEPGKYMKITSLHSRKQQKLPLVSYKVPEGHVFIVGDNRFPRYSWDSRDAYFGDVSMSMITGRVDYRLFGSNAKVFNAKRSWVATIVMFPYLVLRYLISIDFTRFGSVQTRYLSDKEIPIYSPSKFMDKQENWSDPGIINTEINESGAPESDDADLDPDSELDDVADSLI